MIRLLLSSPSIILVIRRCPKNVSPRSAKRAEWAFPKKGKCDICRFLRLSCGTRATFLWPYFPANNSHLTLAIEKKWNLRGGRGARIAALALSLDRHIFEMFEMVLPILVCDCFVLGKEGDENPSIFRCCPLPLGENRRRKRSFSTPLVHLKFVSVCRFLGFWTDESLRSPLTALFIGKFSVVDRISTLQSFHHFSKKHAWSKLMDGDNFDILISLSRATLASLSPEKINVTVILE